MQPTTTTADCPAPPLRITCARGGEISLPREEAATFIQASLEDALDLLDLLTKPDNESCATAVVARSRIQEALDAYVELTKISDRS